MRFLGNFSARVYQSAAAWTLVFTIVRSVGNLLVLPLMLHKLPQEHLGLWYAFLSIAGAAGLIDLGFFPTMSRATAYLWAGAEGIQKFGVATVQSKLNGARGPNYKKEFQMLRSKKWI
jgi:hypothetical protein